MDSYGTHLPITYTIPAMNVALILKDRLILVIAEALCSLRQEVWAEQTPDQQNWYKNKAEVAVRAGLAATEGGKQP